MTTTEPRLAHPPAVAEPDPVLSIRPRVRHDALFADTGDGVLLRGDDAARRFLDFRSTRVLVLGSGATMGDEAYPSHLLARTLRDRDGW